MSIPLHILILAAGQGKRMHSKTPKVLHLILFRPMIHYVLDLARSTANQSLSLIVGHDSDGVREACGDYPEVQYFEQTKPLGTAHAVLGARDFLSAQKGNVLILSGDVILLGQATLKALVTTHLETRSACTLLTAHYSDPQGYGRILRQEDGTVRAIREDVDCSDTERKIAEVNAGIYCFALTDLLCSLARVTNTNRQAEYYLTDAVCALLSDKKSVHAITVEDPRDTQGINDRHDLLRVESILQKRVNHQLVDQGVTIREIHTTFIDPRCVIDPDVEIEGACTLINSVIKSGVKIESHSRIMNSMIGSGTVIKQGSHIEKSEIGDRCRVGPYARLRPGTVLKTDVTIGNFVELKESVMGSHSKASHLSYIGDAEVGQSVNLGCGFVTCNFDGTSKHKTTIEDNVFVGSDSQTVAPVTIGKGSYIASGTTVTDNVPEESLVLGRVRQITKPGYAKKYRRKEGR